MRDADVPGERLAESIRSRAIEPPAGSHDLAGHAFQLGRDVRIDALQIVERNAHGSASSILMNGAAP